MKSDRNISDRRSVVVGIVSRSVTKAWGKFHNYGAVLHPQCGGDYTTLYISKYMELSMKRKKAILLYEKLKSKNNLKTL